MYHTWMENISQYTMAAIEKDEIDDFFSKVDISAYKCVYVSYGSHSNNGGDQEQHTYSHANPEFLNALFHFTGIRYLCISIDPRYTKFTYKKYRSQNGNKKFTFVTIPVHEMDVTDETDYRAAAVHSIEQTIAITKKIIPWLSGIPYVLFVNFIKFRNSGHVFEDTLYKESLRLKEVPYDYYDWCGYGPYSHFILKTSDERAERVKELQKDKDFLPLLKSNTLEKKYDAESIKHCLFPITRESVFDVYYCYYLFPDMDKYETKGGRTRKSKRRNVFKTLRRFSRYIL